MLTEKQLDKKLKQQSEEIKRHFDVTIEDFDKKVDTLVEGWQMTKDKVDATFEITGQINIKVTDLQLRVGRLEKSVIQIRKDVEIMKSDISFIKNELKQKVDRDEFATLEKRLILLENKFKRI